ncbi:unnamed protein product [Medioppia subpectinata]|uniref:Fe2OG dioxygenase domain-containing protein n=1 Tax=Medioppia subpectinata TaxID=1979941 RepID=A0A7R9PV80_9ACAR|nr:unnamed protein product [Medioppia subpectinata]CAG2101586.1 unnamed protein product [Medioppia subpectinata]
MAIISILYYRCKCFLTNNYFVSKYKTHVKYANNDTDFWSQFGDQLSAVGCNTDDKRSEVLTQLKTEFDRRNSLDNEIAKRTQFIKTNYTPKHPEIYKLDDKYLQKAFIDLVDRCRRGDTFQEVLPFVQTISLEKRVFKFNIFTEDFCRKFVEEIDNFNDSPMPKTRPNTMNNYGILLNELGFDEHFLTPLREHYLNPMAKVFFPDWLGAGLDTHRAFTIKYSATADAELFTHYDNSEITLNVCLGNVFEGSEVYFGDFRTKPRRDANDLAVAAVEHRPGVGLFHLGQLMHGTLPVTDGERQNLVVWMRSSEIRNQLCPMCDHKPEPIPSVGFGDGFTVQ